MNQQKLNLLQQYFNSRKTEHFTCTLHFIFSAVHMPLVKYIFFAFLVNCN